MRLRIINFLFAILLLSIPALVLQPPGDGYLNYSDFPAYYSAAKLIAQHKSADVYKPDMVRKESLKHFQLPDRVVFVAEPPYAMPLVIPLSFLPPKAARNLCTFGAIALVAASLLILADVLSLTNRATLLLICFSALSGPFVECVRHNKPTPLLLLGLCLSLFWLKRAKTSNAAVASLLTLIKPHEFFGFFGFCVGAKKFPYLCLIGALLGLIACLSTAVFGFDAWTNYFNVLSNMSEHPEIVGIHMMPTFKGQLYRLELNHSIANQISVVAFFLSVLGSAMLARRFNNDRRFWKIGAAIGMLLGFVFLTHAHGYDLILTIPAVAIIIEQGRKHGNRSLLLAAWSTVAAFSLPLYILIHYVYMVYYGAVLNVHFAFLGLLTVVAVRYAHQLGDYQKPRVTLPKPLRTYAVRSVQKV